VRDLRAFGNSGSPGIPSIALVHNGRYVTGWLNRKIDPLHIFVSMGGAVEEAAFILAEHFTEKETG